MDNIHLNCELTPTEVDIIQSICHHLTIAAPYDDLDEFEDELNSNFLIRSMKAQIGENDTQTRDMDIIQFNEQLFATMRRLSSFLDTATHRAIRNPY